MLLAGEDCKELMAAAVVVVVRAEVLKRGNVLFNLVMARLPISSEGVSGIL